MTIFAAIAVASCSFLCVRSTSAQQVLRWRLVPGETIGVEIQQDIDAQASMIGAEMKSSANMALTMNWNVQDVAENGTATIQQSIERFRMKMSSPGQESVEIDSNSPERAVGMAKMVLDSVRPMIGISVIQHMSARGEILDVELSEEAKRQLQAGGGVGELQQVFSAEGMKSILSQSAAVLPEAPVKPGDRWQGSAQSESPAGMLLIDLAYLYRGTVDYVGQPLEEIDVTLTMSLDAAQNENGIQVRIADQHGTGKMYFDARAGRFVRTQLNQSMTMETTFGQQKQVQKIATEMKIDFVSRQRAIADRRPTGPAPGMVRPVATPK